MPNVQRFGWRFGSPASPSCIGDHDFLLRKTTIRVVNRSCRKQYRRVTVTNIIPLSTCIHEISLWKLTDIPSLEFNQMLWSCSCSVFPFGNTRYVPRKNAAVEQTHFFLLLFNINLVRKKLASRKNLESRFRRNVKISERDYSNRPSGWPITLESKFASSNLRFSIFTCVQWKRRWKRDTQREIDVSQDLRIYVYIYIYTHTCTRRKKRKGKKTNRVILVEI